MYVPDAYTVDISTKKWRSIVLKSGLALQKDEVIDAAFLSKSALKNFMTAQIQRGQRARVLFSVHLKATMMKVSIRYFRTYHSSLLQKYTQHIFQRTGTDWFQSKQRIGDLYDKLDQLPQENNKRSQMHQYTLCQRSRACDGQSDKGITNLHVPTMLSSTLPCLLHWKPGNVGSKRRNPRYQAVIPIVPMPPFIKKLLIFVRTWCLRCYHGPISNVGLMAQKQKSTVLMTKLGNCRLVEPSRYKIKKEPSSSQKVEQGDIWHVSSQRCPHPRLGENGCISPRTVGCAVFEHNQTGTRCSTYRKVQRYLTITIQRDWIFRFVSKKRCAIHSIAFDLVKTVSVTGSILRDYLTDLFPILELGTSAKMLSIVPLMKGGALLETGAGGSAPALLDQFFKENHLCWDSLGEFLALQVSLEHYAKVHNHPKAQALSDALDIAITEYLQNNRSPKLKVRELDTRGSHFYLALWAQALKEQNQNTDLKHQFSALSKELNNNEHTIVQEFNDAQGCTVSLKGYYRPCSETCAQIMRPSETFNRILARF